MPVTIVGIGPANHRGTIDIGLGTDFWLPITAVPAIFPNFAPRSASNDHRALVRESPSARWRHRGAGQSGDGRPWTPARGREPGSSFAARASLRWVRASRSFPRRTCESTRRRTRRSWRIASLVLVIVGLVLAIACSNLATLLLVRGAARAKEVSVRLAMGATRRQLVRHLLTESLLLSLAGGIAGCILAWWGMRRAASDRPPVQSRSDPRLPRARLCDRAVAGHGRGVRPGAGAQGHEGRPPADAARRGAAADRSSAAHAEERADRLSGGGLGAAARRHEHLPADGGSGAERCASAMPSTASRCSRPTCGLPATRRTTRGGVYDELLRRIEAIPGVESAALLRGLPMDPQRRVDRRRRRGRSNGIGRGSGHDRGRAGLLRDAAHPAAVRPRVRRARPRGHASRRGDHRPDGAAVLWRGERRRPAIPVGRTIRTPGPR